MYADDTLIICKADNIDVAAIKAQEAMNQMFNWCTANKLSMNLSKTQYLTVKHVQSNIEPTVCVNNTKISTVNTYEYLGMILDNRLSMNDYVDNM